MTPSSVIGGFQCFRESVASILKMKAECFPKALVTTYKTTRFHNQGDHNPSDSFTIHTFVFYEYEEKNM
jgi:hypothetical protein